MLRFVYLLFAFCFVPQFLSSCSRLLAVPPRSKTKCVSRFQNDLAHFERCRNVPCIIFVAEGPFIVLNKSMTSEEDVKLFPCEERNKFFPGLHGLSFNVQDRLPLHDAYCVFGGPACTYDGMIQFLDGKKDYQFFIGGLMFALPHRISRHARPTSPLVEYKMAIIGRRDATGPIVQAYTTVLRPFQIGTWLMLLGFALFFIFIRVLIAVHFSQPRTIRNIGRHLAGEYDMMEAQLRPVKDKDTVHILNKVALRSLILAVTAFFAVIVLFYEISIVNFIFNKQGHKLERGLNKLGPDQLKQYIIIRGGGTEAIWRKFADPGKIYENITPPWHFCTGDDDWHSTIRLLTKGFQLFLIRNEFQPVVRYQLQKRKACDKLTVFDTTVPSYGFAAGWYYGSGVPIETQNKIDKSILRLRIHDKLRELSSGLFGESVPLNCGTMSADIPPGILGWILLTVLGFTMIPVFAALMYSSWIKHRHRRRTLQDGIEE